MAVKIPRFPARRIGFTAGKLVCNHRSIGCIGFYFMVISTLGWVKVNQLTPSYNLGVPVASGIRGLTPEGHTEELQGRHVPVRSKAFRIPNEGAQVLGTCGKYANKKTGLITETKSR